MLMQMKPQQRGLTLVEVMVGVVVGLIVVSGVLTVYTSTVQSSSSALKSSRLNQEMGATMNIMVNDIRRAGYWENSSFYQPTLNPFNQVDTTTPANTTALRVYDRSTNTDMTDNATLANRKGDCIVYSYDRPGGTAGTVDNNEKLGFRLGRGDYANEVQMRLSSTGDVNNCETGTWNSLTDRKSILITNLEFDLSNSECLNTSEPNGEDEAPANGTVDEFAERDCYLAAYAPDSGERTVELRDVLITLQAQLADDSSVAATMQQTVQVRNNLIRER